MDMFLKLANAVLCSWMIILGGKLGTSVEPCMDAEIAAGIYIVTCEPASVVTCCTFMIRIWWLGTPRIDLEINSETMSLTDSEDCGCRYGTGMVFLGRGYMGCIHCRLCDNPASACLCQHRRRAHELQNPNPA